MSASVVEGPSMSPTQKPKPEQPSYDRLTMIGYWQWPFGYINYDWLAMIYGNDRLCSTAMSVSSPAPDAAPLWLANGCMAMTVCQWLTMTAMIGSIDYDLLSTINWISAMTIYLWSAMIWLELWETIAMTGGYGSTGYADLVTGGGTGTGGSTTA